VESDLGGAAPLGAGPTGPVEPVELARSTAASLCDEPELAYLVELLLALADSLESERKRVVRIGLDLHDGALQDIALLGADMHVFREQLGSPSAFDNRQRIVGRVDDLIARLSAVGAQLRELATMTDSAELLRRPLATTLTEVVASYCGSLAPHTTIDPNLDESLLTDSQKIAVLRIAGAAVSNAARHSGAKNVFLTIKQLADGIEVSIRDDGAGFAVQSTLRGAAQNRRLGLAGMRERAALLGGRLLIESSPGGPTEVLLQLPSWQRGRDAGR
jgi:Signal transduction histidine kinase